MAEFPKLKTGAVAQYPLEVSNAYATRILQFVDGTEQRYRERGPALRRWVIRLDLLDEAESAALEEFVAAQQGRLGDFTFVDPSDQQEYPSCSLASDAAEMIYASEGRRTTRMVIRENGA